MRYELKPLPYDYSALEPVISKEILMLHHDKHHQPYVNGANAALEKLELARDGNQEISIKAVMKDLSFNLNGHLLHELFWII
jgi:Fe-Mn family superoxide dismutase